MELKVNSLKKIYIDPINSRTIRLNCNGINPIEIREQYQDFDQVFFSNKILELKFYKKSVKLGDEFVINGLKYKVNKIELKENYNYNLIETVLNKSSFYIFPLVTEEGKLANNYLVNYCLYNTYLYWDKYPEYNDGNHLFLVYKFINHESYKKLENEIIQQKNFITLIEDNIFVVFVLKIDKKYNYILRQFWEGKYHNFIPPIKETIISFFNTNNNINEYLPALNTVKAVLNNDKTMRERLERKLNINLPKNMNFESKPDVELETCKL